MRRFSTARIDPDLVCRPTAVEPSLMASMAYSTWKRRPSGEKVLTPLSYSERVRYMMLVGFYYLFVVSGSPRWGVGWMRVRIFMEVSFEFSVDPIFTLRSPERGPEP